MRAVVDTNVLVSGLLSAEAPPARVLMDITTARLRPVVCDAVMEEYEAVLFRPRLQIDTAQAARALELIRATAEWVAVPVYGGTPALPDVADWPFIACTLVAGCPVVTGNVKHIPARLGVRVMTAREWVEGGGD